jgi:hypothetical protein
MILYVLHLFPRTILPKMCISSQGTPTVPLPQLRTAQLAVKSFKGACYTKRQVSPQKFSSQNGEPECRFV